MDHWNDKEYNKALIEKYPFLLPRNRWTGEVAEDYDYEYTELDNMDDGWREAFGEQMCQEIMDALVEADYVDEFRIVQLKEKYGNMRFYCGPAPQTVHDIISKYEAISAVTCIKCGKPAEYVSDGWISPFCAECAQDITDGYNKRSNDEDYPITEYFSEMESWWRPEYLEKCKKLREEM